MKKTLLVIGILLIVFVLSIYISTKSSESEVGKEILVNLDNVKDFNFRAIDSVEIIPSDLYRASEFKEIVQGEHYRATWSTAVKVPVLYLDTLRGGVNIIEEGGGKQTHSLKIEDKQGIILTLRSITKDPSPLISEPVSALGLENVVIDGISAQHPFGASAVAELANALDILHTKPKMVFLPRQSKLNEFNEKFGNRLFWLEYETEGDVNWTPFKNVKELADTDNLQKLRREYKDKVDIDHHALVRARLFDIIIGDWDRHAKQWGWVIKEHSDNRFRAIPIPGDRDNAFFDVDGLMPTIISNKMVKPKLRPFNEDIDYLPGLTQKFDRYFLQHTPREIFVSEANYIKEKLTDEVIDRALKTWPKPIYNLDGKDIGFKIKKRRDNLVRYAKEFHEAIINKGHIREPLAGSEDEDFEFDLLTCFHCNGHNSIN